MPVIQFPETILWTRVEDKLPDDDTSVLVYAPLSDEPVWVGWYDGVYWFAADAADYADGAVKAWAPLPRGLET
jgi:hypothetical protein